MYEALKVIHILGVVVLIGNVTVTAFWKALADRSGDAAVIAFAQRGVTISDWLFTLTGITLIMVGGYGAAYVQGLPLLDAKWLVAGQLFFAVSGCIWLGVLVPLQMRQARAAKAFQPGDTPPPSYRRDSRSWLVWGIVATIPLIAAIYVMVEK